MDTIANMLTTILNAQATGKQRIALPYSRFKESLAKLLKEQGWIASVRVQEGPTHKLIVTLAYDEDGKPRLSGARRLSKPGLRRYAKSSDIPFADQGVIVISTPQGLMDGAKAREHSVGGELICHIW